MDIDLQGGIDIRQNFFQREVIYLIECHALKM